jgi:hypothetical protein
MNFPYPVPPVLDSFIIRKASLPIPEFVPVTYRVTDDMAAGNLTNDIFINQGFGFVVLDW